MAVEHITTWSARMRLLICMATIFGLLVGALHLLPTKPVRATTIPRIFNYQAKITDALNVTLADGVYDVAFALYDSDVGGTCLWSADNTDADTDTIDCAGDTPDGQIAVTVTDGVFSVLLGDTTAGLQNTIPDIADAVLELWLGVTIEGDAEMAPRKRIVSALLAEEAADAELLDGFDSSQAGGADSVLITTAAGDLDMGTGLILNIGDAGTNFIAGGGLTLAGVFTANGTSLFNDDMTATFGADNEIAEFNKEVSLDDLAAVDDDPDVAIARAITVPGIGDTAFSNGTVLRVQNVDAAGAGTLVDTTDVLTVSQENNEGTGSALTVVQLGTGTAVMIEHAGTSGNLLEVIDSGVAGLLVVNGGDVQVSPAGGATSGLFVGGVAETLANAGFTLDGDDAFIAGLLGVEGNVYTDGAFITGATTTYADGSITSSGAFTLTTGGAILLGDGGDTGQIDTSDWDISTTGELTGVGPITTDGMITVDTAGGTNLTITETNINRSANDTPTSLILTNAGANTGAAGEPNFTLVARGGLGQSDSILLVDSAVGSPLFQVNQNGSVIIAASQSYTGAGAVTLASDAGGDVIINAAGMLDLRDTIVNSAGDVTFGDVVAIAPTTTGTFLDFQLETEWTSGTLINADFAVPTTQTGNLIGLNLDLGSSLTGGNGNNSFGIQINSTGGTYSGAGIESIRGINVAAPAITQNTLAGTVEWTGIYTATPNITQTTGTITAYGMYIATGDITTGGSQRGIVFSMGGVGAGTLTGIDIFSIVPDAGTETAISIGSGWDDAININSGTLIAETSGALAINPNTTGTMLDFELATEWTSGTLINANYASATMQSGGDITGLALDFNTNFTGAAGLDLNGVYVQTPPLTQTGVSATSYQGLRVSGGALEQNTAAGTIGWMGVGVTLPSLTETTGTVGATGLTVFPQSASASGSQVGIAVSGIATGPAAGLLTGLLIDTIGTPGAGVETAIMVGTGWDTAITTGEGNINFALGAAEMVFIDASTVAHTDATGVLNINFDANVAMARGLNIDLTDSSGLGAVTAAIGSVVSITPDVDDDATSIYAGYAIDATDTAGPRNVRGLVMTDGAGGALSLGGAGELVGLELFLEKTGVGAGDVMGGTINVGRDEAGTLIGLAIELNPDNAALASTGTGININETGAGGGAIGIDFAAGQWTTGIDFSGPTITNEIVLQNSESIDNAVDGAVRLKDGVGTHILDASTTSFKINLDDTTGTYTERLCHSGADAASGVVEVADCSGTPGDLAEHYGSDGTLEAGDVVIPAQEAVDIVIKGQPTSRAWVRKSETAYDSRAIGIVSTKPSDIMGNAVFRPAEYPVPVALVGRVPVKVTDEGGPIAPGDFLAASGTPGFAMKATQEGRVIGVALESHRSGTGKIVTFVNPGWFNGTSVETPHNTATMMDALSVQNLDIENDLFLHGGTISGIGRLLSLNGTWSIDELGTLVVVAIETERLTTEELTVRLTDGRQIVGEATIPAGQTMMRVNNELIDATSKVFVTFRSRVPAGWWISEVSDNWFELALEEPSSDGDLIFDYWIVHVEDVRTPTPTPSPPPVEEENEGVVAPEPEPAPEPAPEPEPTPEPAPAPEPTPAPESAIVVEEPAPEPSEPSAPPAEEPPTPEEPVP